jgi:demethylmenaquinone methyltransferase/2-methoxy-6-polyprenyl-1,4-benzoquinol methylase
MMLGMAESRLDWTVIFDEQIEYYRARSSSYDDAYRRAGAHDKGPEKNREWLADMEAVEAAFAQAHFGREVLELGSGTGHWTERLVRRGHKVTAVDAAPESLAVAAARTSGLGEDPEFVVADLYNWHPPRTWDSLVTCFFIEHVPDHLVEHVVGRVASALRPGGSFFFAEGLALAPTDAEVETRTLHGREYRVVERRRPPEALQQLLAKAGIDVDVSTVGSRFVYGIGRKL